MRFLSAVLSVSLCFCSLASDVKFLDHDAVITTSDGQEHVVPGAKDQYDATADKVAFLDKLSVAKPPSSKDVQTESIEVTAKPESSKVLAEVVEVPTVKAPAKTLVLYTSPTCAPCRQMKYNLKAAGIDYVEGVETAATGIEAYPTLVVVGLGGKEETRLVGLTSVEHIRGLLDAKPKQVPTLYDLYIAPNPGACAAGCPNGQCTSGGCNYCTGCRNAVQRSEHTIEWDGEVFDSKFSLGTRSGR